jgi:hypothetical protein
MTNPKLKIVHLPVDKIRPNEWNPNRQSDVVAQAQRESMETFGFINPITVRPHPDEADAYEIVNGEHRWRDSVERGDTEVPAVLLDLDDAAARKLTIVLNETAGDADVIALGQLLAELEKLLPEDEFKTALPYTPSELEHLLELGRADWSDGYQRDGMGDGSGAGGGEQMDELIVSLPAPEMAQLHTYLDIIQREAELETASEAVLYAAEHLARSLNQS